MGLLVMWLGCEIGSSKGGVPRNFLLDRNEALAGGRRVIGKAIEEYKGRYDIADHPCHTGIALNGEGWNEDLGIAGPVIVLVIDSPKFVELDVGDRLTIGQGSSDSYRARIGGVELRPEEIFRDGEYSRVRFSVPEEIRQKSGQVALFLCFIRTCSEDDTGSQRILQSVRWR